MSQAHEPFVEDPRVHQLEVGSDEREEAHLVENVGLQVDARSNLRQFQSGTAQPEDAAFGDVPHCLFFVEGVLSGEGHMLDAFDELA